MWHATYTGPHDGDLNSSWTTWDEARFASELQIKIVAPVGTYSMLIVSCRGAKQEMEWGASDGVHTFAVTRGDAQGWTGEKCRACGGHGVTSGDEFERACTQCGGTGDENIGPPHTTESATIAVLDTEAASILTADSRFTCAAYPGCGCQAGADLPCAVPIITHTEAEDRATDAAIHDRPYGPVPDNVACVAALTGAFDCEWPGCGCEVVSQTPDGSKCCDGMADPQAVVSGSGVAEIDREHSELGASIATRWRNCPASVRLVRGQPNPSSSAAQRGTAAHEVAHMCLLTGLDAVDCIGQIVNGIEVDAQIADGVQAYLDDCRACPATETRYEVRFTLASLNPPSPMFGTADFVGYDAIERRLYVKDYKNGFMAVDAVGNDQLRYYALGALLWLGDDKPVSDVHVTICQPNSLGATLKTDTFDAVDLVEWSRDLIADAHRTTDPNAPVVVGPWCAKPGANCPVAGRCVTHAAHKLEAAQVEFSDYLSAPRVPEVRLLSAAERGAIHGAADGLRAFLNAVEDSIRRDTSGTGWKVVPTDPRQAWRDKDDAAMTLRVDHGIDPYEPAEVISPAVACGKIATALHAERVSQHATGKKPTKKDAEMDARKVLASLIVDISSGTKLVPEADPRPAVSTGGAEFESVTQ